ncbi:conserved hypothetical protein TIGR03089 [Aeromicrobium marinum DSM 15272]|uniref:TIGR03089 family protein n=1 Tax=Aeromicrobium marinum DSM 15272 TaxID=585531 RepID=E2SDT8_9ACTN|nr:TIGR03089 family protein [Aeromicrobium marinum]EFQ82665.1 conserved hypothetical protein TIGR03089 [Aeromicrobium marinum DSM 15272]
MSGVGRGTLAGLLDRVADRSAPFVTHYDESTGERTELSATTAANWVAKTANFLVDELDAAPGTRLRLGLPTHWQRVVWLLSAWEVGAAVTDGPADIGVSGPELRADEPVRLAASLLPFGARFPDPPAGFVDLGAELPGQGDHFLALDPPTPDEVALDLGGTTLTHRQLLTTTVPDPRRLVVTPGDVGRDARLVTAAATGGGSLVLVTAADPDRRAAIAVQEQAT